MARHATLNELQDSRSVFSEFFKDSNVGLATFDPQLRYCTLNNCLAATHRTPADYHVGKHLREILGDVASQVEPAIRQVFATARPVMNREIVGTLPTRAEKGHWISNFFPITDSIGSVVQVGAVVVELGTDVRVEPASPENAAGVLRSWKEIANYVGTCVKTVQRWEQVHQFPIRRVEPGKGAVVFALRNEVEEWLRGRTSIARTRE
jgi:predicted DNA-binding transcriptional regulator AlpA